MTKPPQKREIILVLRGHVRTLKRSYTCRNGPNKNKIAEPEIRRDIECIEAAIGIVRSGENKRRRPQGRRLNLY